MANDLAWSVFAPSNWNVRLISGHTSDSEGIACLDQAGKVPASEDAVTDCAILGDDAAGVLHVVHAGHDIAAFQCLAEIDLELHEAAARRRDVEKTPRVLAFAYPVFGGFPIKKIDAATVLKALQQVEAHGRYDCRQHLPLRDRDRTR